MKLVKNMNTKSSKKQLSRTGDIDIGTSKAEADHITLSMSEDDNEVKANSQKKYRSP